MYSFKNDYSEGAHPSILEALVKYNLVQEDGYGEDTHSVHAKDLITKHLGDNNCDIHFIPGGTLTNLIAISSFLRPHEACISAFTGHIATHETGAVEATGHKIIELQTTTGKLTKDIIAPTLKEHHFEHMVKPKLVYISNPTEVGTVYNKEELKDLYSFCQDNDLLLYCDGARLGMALTLEEELTLEDMATYTDAFFIGGAKIGALVGEALVISTDHLKADMRYYIKQKGALLSKGRLLGIQFEALFTNDLYFELARHGNRLAKMITDGFKDLGCEFMIDSPTNQVFPILDNRHIDKLMEDYEFYIWKEIDKNSSAIRLITSWATTEETVVQFIKDFTSIISKG